MKVEFEKSYNWTQLEDQWYARWLKKDYFTGDENSSNESFSIVIPPPNITGKLTMGHVLNNTIQDVLIRKARMEGKNTCWIPGIDHASIATETKVVKMLEEMGIEKEQLSREEFLDHAWKWKEKYGGIIIDQLKKLGCSCDWKRQKFTMDDDYSRSVIKAFVHLYNKGFIYKGHRLVNWCPSSQSAISDEEVIHKEISGKLWYFKYPIEKDKSFLVVATTRPETLLGDTAIAVNPEDERYAHLVGSYANIPIVNRKVPIIADEHVDPKFGTGCVKVTPAHDPNDFEIGKRHGLEFINIMNDDASLNENVPQDFQGLSRERVRKEVIKRMNLENLLEKTEDHINNIGFSERGNVPIEFYMSEQWYMKMNKLVKPALDAVNDGKIKFYPNHWVKTYNHWMENINDWCISRQLSWGHQIPVWYHKDDVSKLHVSEKGPDDKENWVRDKDVLDTWASSWLWPFAVHNWIEKDTSIKKYYPTNTLVTGPDIIFFWVARMIMSGYEFLGEEPFKNVYFTSILRDANGKKFSKSLGNSPDPITLFKEFGTDAVRFGTLLMAPQGLDVLFSKDRLEVGKNFMNKLWNAARFTFMNLIDGIPPDIDLRHVNLGLSDKWIISRFEETAFNVNRELNNYRFNEAAKAIYEFTWNDYCDWYVEIAKIRLYGDDPKKADIARAVLIHVLRGILTLLHPYSPFITEELWSYFKTKNEKDLIISPWINGKVLKNEQVFDSMDLLQQIVTSIRAIRSQLNIPPKKRATVYIVNSESFKEMILSFDDVIKMLAGVNHISFVNNKERPSKSATAVIKNMELFIPLEGLIDFDLEINRLSKRIDKLKKHILVSEKKLSNKNFVANAPENIITHEKEKMIQLKLEKELLKKNLKMIS